MPLDLVDHDQAFDLTQNAHRIRETLPVDGALQIEDRATLLPLRQVPGEGRLAALAGSEERGDRVDSEGASNALESLGARNHGRILP